MVESKAPFLSGEEIEELLAPVALSDASGDWIASREALTFVEQVCSVDSAEAQKALCRRAVVIVPVTCATWSVALGPHVGPDGIDFSSPVARENQHFKRTLDRQSFEEILQFFKALEFGSDREGYWAIEHGHWSTGDFRVHLEYDFRTITLSVVGLQFDKVAIERAFSEAGSGIAQEIKQLPRKSGGRPRTPAWTDWIAELSSFIHDNGYPEGSGSQGQEAIINGVSERLAQRGLDGPSRSTVQAVVQAVLDRHRGGNS